MTELVFILDRSGAMSPIGAFTFLTNCPSSVEKVR